MIKSHLLYGIASVMQSIFEKHTFLIAVHDICFISTDASNIGNAANQIQIQSETTDVEECNSDGTENVDDRIVVVTGEGENTKSIEENTTPPNKVENSSVRKLLGRLKNKKHQAKHTNGFDIPKKILKKLKRKRDKWQVDENPVEKKSKISKQTNNACQSQPNAVGSVNETNSTSHVKNSATTRKSLPATATPKSDFKRSNLLRINYSSTKKNSDSFLPNGMQSMHGQPVTKSNTNENDLTQNNSEPTCHDNSDGLPWKPKSSYTEQLCDYFTLQTDLRPSEQSTLDATQSPSIKKQSLKYKCKICDDGGSNSRVSGIVTCPYGNSSNMRRHMLRVSVFCCY